MILCVLSHISGMDFTTESRLAFLFVWGGNGEPTFLLVVCICWVVCHGILRSITRLRDPLMHHCVLYSKVKWSPSGACRLSHWYAFIYKTILGKLPVYLSSLLNVRYGDNSLRSLHVLHVLLLPKSKINRKKSFNVFAPTAWNNLPTELKTQNFKKQINK